MKLRRLARRFVREQKALAALEFAVIAPTMILLLFGSVDLLDMMDTNQRVENAASSLADIVARDTQVSDAEVEGIWAALDVLISPNELADIDLRITSVSIESAAVARVVWSEAHGMAARTENSTVDLPDGMMIPGSSIIMAEAEMEYAGPLNFLLAAPITLSHDAYRRSRLVDPIPRS